MREPGDFATPTSMAVDRDCNLYALDADNNRVQKLSPSRQYLAQRAGHDDRFFIYTSMAMDTNGDLDVSVHNRVLKTCTVTMALAAGHVISSLSWGAEVRLATAG